MNGKTLIGEKSKDVFSKSKKEYSKPVNKVMSD